MYGFPKTQEVMDLISSLIKEEDDAKHARTGARPNTVNSKIRGLVAIEYPDKRELIPIEQTVGYDFQTDHRRIGTETQNASFIKTTDGDIKIIANDSLIDNQLENMPEWKKSLGQAIIMHEIGHHLSGHLETKPKLKLDRIDYDRFKKANDPTPVITEALLDGAVFDVELEADIQAMKIIDDPLKIIGLHAYLASTSDTLGVRMEHQNRVDRLIEILESDEWNQQNSSNIPVVHYEVLTEDYLDSLQTKE